MQDTVLIERIRQKYLSVKVSLNEHARRRWAAAEAQSLGWGGITAVAKATGLSDRTIRTGLHELKQGISADGGRQRKPGGGRPATEIAQPGLLKTLRQITDSTSRGNPMTPLRWTCKSMRTIASELARAGYVVSHTKVGELLRQQGYSLQGNRKTIEGKQHPDRNAQFEHIANRASAYLRTGQPAISVDTKKKEPPGKLKNPGKTYRKKGMPVEVATHDFPDKELGKAVPYGVYDLANNEAGVTVGISHDTAEFAVAAISRWWTKLGRKRYPSAKRLLITADSGGSNGPRTRLWRLELQRLANSTGMKIEVCHFPAGTSKWNKIEHRLFCHITRNWQGVPLETFEIVVKLIGNTKTREGLEVHAWLDQKQYLKARTVTDVQLLEVNMVRNKFHGEWNYTILPET
jgi:transposase